MYNEICTKFHHILLIKNHNLSENPINISNSKINSHQNPNPIETSVEPFLTLSSLTWEHKTSIVKIKV